eukprot:Nitzschia sp. Nitz4//scaffold1_size375055//142945//144581//NITZ4_000257-RA/size375055-augustus-gene-0.670-mRNA-1//1//CDS//3329540988//3407//frame0
MSQICNKRYKVTLWMCLFLAALAWQVYWNFGPTCSISILTPNLESDKKCKRDGKLACQTSMMREPYSCQFRDYDKHPNRFYGLSNPDYPKPFLRTALYIHGKPPMLLPSIKSSPLNGKVCGVAARNSSSNGTLTMDGTNPSIVSLTRLLTESLEGKPWKQLLKEFKDLKYVVSATFKFNNQCIYDHDAPGKSKSKFDLIPGRVETEADLLFVDSQLRTILHSHIWDGEKIMEQDNSGAHFLADDVRLFIHEGALWISYKRYTEHDEIEVQYITQLHLEYRKGNGWDSGGIVATAYQSQAVALCCGRNFGTLVKQAVPGFLGSSRAISFLTWPDPVWVQSVNTSAIPQNRSIRLRGPGVASLMSNKRPSRYHGTSNQLLYLVDTDEYLGIGHIHRERKWGSDRRRDAAFGHHYTHSYFTVSARAPFHLRRLSPEFVFPSMVDGYQNDADVVQFASGLEWSTDGPERSIVIGYGINDCEAAVVHIDWKTVEEMLVAVDLGTQVAQTMSVVPPSDFLQKVGTL